MTHLIETFQILIVTFNKFDGAVAFITRSNLNIYPQAHFITEVGDKLLLFINLSLG